MKAKQRTASNREANVMIFVLIYSDFDLGVVCRDGLISKSCFSSCFQILKKIMGRLSNPRAYSSKLETQTMLSSNFQTFVLLHMNFDLGVVYGHSFISKFSFSLCFLILKRRIMDGLTSPQVYCSSPYVKSLFQACSQLFITQKAMQPMLSQIAVSESLLKSFKKLLKIKSRISQINMRLIEICKNFKSQLSDK